MPKHRSKTLVLLTLGAMLILVIAAFIILKPKKTQLPRVTINRQGQPQLGNPKARIHIVAFEDLKCTNCKIFNMTLFPEIKKKYIDTGKANYTFINLAFIPGSLPAANAARCLYAQNKNYFFPFIDYVFQHQPDESENWATIATLIQFARAAVPKADLKQLSTCMIEARYNPVIQENLKIATHAMSDKVATPALYINGQKIETLTLRDIEIQIARAPKEK